MKQNSEQKAQNAIKELLQTLERNFNDTGIVLDQYEATHSDYELCYSKEYNALAAGHLALKDAIDRINDQLNKK